MLKLVPLEIEHAIDIYPYTRGECEDLTMDQFIDMTRKFSQLGAAYAAVDEKGECYGLGGVFQTHIGSGHVWLCLTDKLKGHGLWLSKTLKRQLRVIMEFYGMWRVQGDVLLSKPEWIRWAKLIGFEEEGVMRKYGINQQDFVRVARVL